MHTDAIPILCRSRIYRRVEKGRVCNSTEYLIVDKASELMEGHCWLHLERIDT
jgi:hypothetical protein